MRAVMKNAYRKEYEEYICVDALGMLFRPSYVSSHFEVILKRNGLRKIRFHDLRHTFSLVALANGVDFKTLSAMLGHYSVAFTLDVYGHVNDDMKRDAADKVSSVLKRAL